jgi:hypothetical protein
MIAGTPGWAGVQGRGTEQLNHAAGKGRKMPGYAMQKHIIWVVDSLIHTHTPSRRVNSPDLQESLI